MSGKYNKKSLVKLCGLPNSLTKREGAYYTVVTHPKGGMAVGKFDGVLFFTDYDDTLYDSSLHVSRENHRAIRYFMEEGGRFSVATGRAHRTFTPQIALEGLKFNAPVVLSNGAAIYDYGAGVYLERTLLDPSVPARVAELCRVFPELGFEAYHGDDIYVHNPNLVTETHLNRVGTPYTLSPIGDMPTPWNKVILEQDEPCLRRVRDYIESHWEGCCEAIFSNRYLLEVTHRGSNKGAMVAKVARMLGIRPEHIYCIGDNQNDIPMLAISAIPFTVANCAPQVEEWGARVLCHCDDHAVARAIEILDGMY